MALEQYAVRLTPDEREQLSQLIRSGKSSARIVARARILLEVAEGWNAPQSGGRFGRVQGYGVPGQKAVRRGGIGSVPSSSVKARHPF